MEITADVSTNIARHWPALGFGTLAQGARDFQSLRTNIIMSDRARSILNPPVGFSGPDLEMDEARADFRHAIWSTRCEIEKGMKGAQIYTPNFAGPLANLNEQWGMRVLTEENMVTYWEDKKLEPAPLLGLDTSEETSHLLSCVRCTEHGSRLEIVEELVRCGLLEQEYLSLRRGGPVPGAVSHCKLINAVPVLRTYINRLEGMHVARTCIFIFKLSVADTLHVHRNTERVISRLREILYGTSFNSKLQCKFEREIRQCAACFMESHTLGTINCGELERNGQGFMVHVADASWHGGYYKLATTACKKRNELPHGPHGDSDYHVAASQILEDTILKSAIAAGVPRGLAYRLSLLIRLGFFFNAECVAYRENPRASIRAAAACSQTFNVGRRNGVEAMVWKQAKINWKCGIVLLFVLSLAMPKAKRWILKKVVQAKTKVLKQ